ncbi:MAG TPA: TonB family protein [Thermoanaerobaculia bacterium]|nr:TonB family protein [Thermoanaerobaculia bacterium]
MRSSNFFRIPRLSRLRHLSAVLGILLLPGLAFAAEPPAPTPAQSQTPSEVLKHANELLTGNKFDEAETEFHRAETLAGGPCGECALGIATVRASEGKWGESADLIQRALPLLTAPAVLSRAYNQLGMAYVKKGGAENLTKAEEAMRSAADYGGAWGNIARVNLAQVLFLEERWADAVPAAREALEKTATDPDMSKAARIILCQARSHLPDELPVEGGDPAGILRAGGDVSHPEKIAGVKPAYTAEARKSQVRGVVVIESIIDAEGCMRNVRVLKGLPDGLSEAALRATRLWVFSPARLQEKPVPVYYSLTVNFQISDTPAVPLRPPQR